MNNTQITIGDVVYLVIFIVPFNLRCSEAQIKISLMI